MKKELCSLEGFATNVCGLKKYSKKVPRMYQVGDSNSELCRKAVVCVVLLSQLCRLCIGLKAAVICVRIVVLTWG